MVYGKIHRNKLALVHAANTPRAVAINLLWRLIAMAILSHSESAAQAVCSACKNPIPDKRLKRKAKYCSRNCGAQFRQGSSRTQFGDSPDSRWLSSGVKGAISELIVCADLLSKGFEVYRAVSQSSKSDLAIVIQPNTAYRVEVTTGYYSRLGRVVHSSKLASQFDLLAVYVPADQSLHYFSNLDCGLLAGRLNLQRLSANCHIK
jgi:hypothetical protein